MKLIANNHDGVPARREIEQLRLEVEALQRRLDQIEKNDQAALTENFSQTGGEIIGKIEDDLMQALRKQHGKRLRLDQPEPRRSGIVRWIQNAFRNQGSLNKYLIGALRHQLDLNRNSERRMELLEERRMEPFSAPPNPTVRGNESQLTSTGQRVYEILRRAGTRTGDTGRNRECGS